MKSLVYYKANNIFLKTIATIFKLMEYISYFIYFISVKHSFIFTLRNAHEYKTFLTYVIL